MFFFVIPNKETQFTNRKAGVIWHTQGSGKSLTIVFYSRQIITDPLMENPTIIMLTDCNDIDNQLFFNVMGVAYYG